jgi:hypothetical protein
MQHVVSRSGRDMDELPITPFRFDPESGSRPTTFEVLGIVDRMRFQYGFSATPSIVTGEWLYAWPRGRIQFWFERTTDVETGAVKCNFGDKLAGDREVWRRATRPNALLLSTAVTLNSAQLRPVFDWFHDKLHVTGVGGWADVFSIEWCGGNRKAEVIRFLQAADLAIEDLRIVHEELSPEMLPDDMPPELKHQIKAEFSGSKMVQVRLSHHANHGKLVELGLDEESDGTQKIFALSAPWLHTLDNGHVIVFDELHDNLHPALVRFLVDRFHAPEVNTKGAQLIFTTHDTSILSQDVFRRDQIWFCERNSRQETTVFPLTEFHPRRGVENLERSYLAGRYGALPYLRSSSLRADD